MTNYIVGKPRKRQYVHVLKNASENVKANHMLKLESCKKFFASKMRDVINKFKHIKANDTSDLADLDGNFI